MASLQNSGRSRLTGDLADRKYGESGTPEDEKAKRAARIAMRAKGFRPKFVLREYRNEDHHYILDTWTKSFLFSDFTRPIARDIFMVEQRARIARILRYSRIMCACDEDDTTRIKGWICFQAPQSEKHYVTVHYICVHPSLQNLGIGRALLNVARILAKDENEPMWCTHYTMPMRKIIERWKLIYNPYCLEVLHVYD